jgi:hypothetical protein
MKHWLKISALLAAVLVFASILPVAAQDNPVCSGLSADECQLLSGASTAMADVQSFAIPSWSFDFTLDTGSPDQSVTMNGSGSAEIMLPADPATSTEDLVVHFTLDNFSATSAGQTQSGSGELIVQGNMVYVLANDQWYGGEMTAEDQQSLQDSLGQMTGGGDMDMSEMGDMDTTGLFNTVASQEDVDGQAATRFATTIDLNVLLPALSDPSMTEGMGETGQQAQMMLSMFSSFLTGTTISFEQVIGQDDNYLHGIALNVDLPAATEGAQAGMSFSGGLHFNADFAQYNETFSVTPPTDFRPLEELESQLNTEM